MSRKKFTPFTIDEIQILEAVAEGKAIAKFNDKVIFIEHAVPGDLVKLNVFKNKKRFYEAKIIELISPSKNRVAAKCKHFGICGGCKWQNLEYSVQIKNKEKQVKDHFQRIGKLEFEKTESIIGCENSFEYRNKLEFTFSNKRWLTDAEVKNKSISANFNSLGFHIQGRFDKILPIDECLLMDQTHNEVRNFIRDKSIELELTFYDHYQKQGDLRNVIIRKNIKNEYMLVIVFGALPGEKQFKLLDEIKNTFNKITSLLYVTNLKLNDTINDQKIIRYSGTEFLNENLGELKFKISPKSFFQTNTQQAENLYAITKSFAGLTGNEIVYDLYTGTGTIACYIADSAKKVVGVEYVEEAITDACENAKINDITNCTFFAGDMKDVLNDDFLLTNGNPDVIITDPPRNGMHPDVVSMLLKIKPKTIVYVSCNSATQARDLDLMRNQYKIEKIQPVDMFPHTHHVECVVKLILQSEK